MKIPRSTTALVCALLYLTLYVGAVVYGLLSRMTFAGLPAILLTLPWSVHLPHRSSGLAGAFLLSCCALLNAAVLYLFVAAVAHLIAPRSRK